MKGMRKGMSSRVHGVLDYLTAGVFLVAPAALGLAGPAAWICYGLAVAHVLLTLLTDFPLGVSDLVPFWLHRGVEGLVGAALLVTPWALSDTFTLKSRVFFSVVAVAVLAVALASRRRRDPEETAE